MIIFKNLDKDILEILSLLAQRYNKKWWCTSTSRRKCYVLRCHLCDHKIYRGKANFHHAVYAMGEHGKEHVEKYVAFL